MTDSELRAAWRPLSDLAEAAELGSWRGTTRDVVLAADLHGDVTHYVQAVIVTGFGDVFTSDGSHRARPSGRAPDENREAAILAAESVNAIPALVREAWEARVLLAKCRDSVAGELKSTVDDFLNRPALGEKMHRAQEAGAWKFGTSGDPW
ncbi:MAG: hypothetical protein ACFCVG_01240 [Kineosporiaceae bacterium]